MPRRYLHVIASASLETGGPIEAVRQVSRVLTEFGCHPELVCLDVPGEVDAEAIGMPVHALGPSRGSYRANPRIVPWLQEHADRYDAVVVHGIWQQHDLAVWRALRRGPVPYFVFPHGMLDPWFKRTYPLKHLKKCLYWPWQHRVLADAAAVLFTCEEERLLARQSFRPYRVREAVVAFGTAAPEGDPEAQREAFLGACPQARSRRLMLFLGRIHPKKGCDLLLDAWAEAARDRPEWLLVMAGPDQVGWQTELQGLAERLGIADRVLWTGMLKGDLKWGAYRASEAFVLPSHQENFGIAVAEALACGLPVLITDKVNIWREIQEDGCGLVGTDDAEGVRGLLQRFFSLTEDAVREMGLRARATFDRRFEVRASARSLLETIDRHRTG
ncbi:MAG: glycosyltransferase [Fimbriimonadaceae bacterium]